MSRGYIYTLIDASLKLNLSFDMCRWLVKDGDVKVVHEVLVIAQVSASGSQGGSSNL